MEAETLFSGGIKFPPTVVEHLRALRPNDDPLILATTYERRARRAYQALLPTVVEWQLRVKNLTNSILDIGCGLAIVDIMLANLLQPEKIQLIDGNGTTPRMREKYHSEQRAWNNVKLGADMVRANVSSNSQVFEHQPNADLRGYIDLIISLRSWGHHFPVNNYLTLVNHCLAEDGLIILDIRGSTNGRQVLEQSGFEYIEQIPDPSIKCQRLAFRRKK